jgi:hypothetical protein
MYDDISDVTVNIQKEKLSENNNNHIVRDTTSFNTTKLTISKIDKPEMILSTSYVCLMVK